MIIQENIPLAPYTTFKIGGPAHFFCSVVTEDEVSEAVIFAKKKKTPFFVLGGGSNILISDGGFPGLVIKIDMKGFNIEDSKLNIQQNVEKVSDSIIVSAAAGESWDSFVDYTVSRGLSGLENLSAIPGTVGAAPVQNIGAYGAEASQFVHAVRAFDTRKMAFIELSGKECKFAYRDSLFKREKRRYIITRVDFKLKKNGAVNIKYKDLEEYFSEKSEANPRSNLPAGGLNPRNTAISVPTAAEVRDAVINIRSRKLPDWKLWGTAGSFFKNCVISADKWNELKKKYPDMPGFPDTNGQVKLPLGWILDKVCNAKGLSMGKAKVYEKQALVLVAMPGATAAEVVALSRELIKRVKEATGIDVEGEVEWVN